MIKSKFRSSRFCKIIAIECQTSEWSCGSKLPSLKVILKQDETNGTRRATYDNFRVIKEDKRRLFIDLFLPLSVREIVLCETLRREKNELTNDN